MYERGSIPGRVSKGIFSPRHRVQTGSGAHPTSYVMSTECSYPGIKHLGRKGDHLPPSSAEVKNEWSYTSPPLPNTSSWRGA
jgi:hypothetical protein